MGSKHVQPVWLSATEADEHCNAGANVWKFCSTDDGIDPNIVLVGIGADLTFEVIAAAAYLRYLTPNLKIRVVNVIDLIVLWLRGFYPHSLSHSDFNALFTTDRHIHFNYHGYAVELQGLLFVRPNLDRVTIEIYQEEGATTTPLDVMIRNRCSRYHVALAAVKGAAAYNPNFCIGFTATYCSYST